MLSYSNVLCRIPTEKDGTMSLSYVEFGKVDLSDVFFDSLKNDYPAFENWFLKKKK